jgi:DNA-binding transcriptional MerR regulator
VTSAQDGWAVGEVAAKVGLSAHTLRWYERMRLLDEIPRDSGGRRRYGLADVERLRLLTKMRATGMPVRDMVRYVELLRGGPGTRLERLRLLEEHRATVLRQIDELQRDLAVIDYKITLYRADPA